MLTSLRNHRTSCPPAPYPAHSLDSLNNAVPFISCIDSHKGSLNLMTSYLMKGGPLCAKSASFSNPTPMTLLPLLIHLLTASPTSPTSAPSITTRLKCTTRLPISDNDPRYSVSSYGHHANITNAEAPKPKTYDKAMASLDAAEWLAACEEEMRTWKYLDIYNVVPQPKGQKVIGSKWVFCVKQGPNGTI